MSEEMLRQLRAWETEAGRLLNRYRTLLGQEDFDRVIYRYVAEAEFKYRSLLLDGEAQAAKKLLWQLRFRLAANVAIVWARKAVDALGGIGKIAGE